MTEIEIPAHSTDDVVVNDGLFDEAKHIIEQSDDTSNITVSFLQRHFKLGYNNALDLQKKLIIAGLLKPQQETEEEPITEEEPTFLPPPPLPQQEEEVPEDDTDEPQPDISAFEM